MTDDNQEILESFSELQDDLHLVIAGMREKIGRLPTEDEVLSFLFAEDDAARQKVLDAAKE